MTKKGRNRLKSLSGLKQLKQVVNEIPEPIFSKGELLPDDYPVCGDYIYMADDKPIRSDIFGDVAKLKADLVEQGISFTNIYSAHWDWETAEQKEG